MFTPWCTEQVICLFAGTKIFRLQDANTACSLTGPHVAQDGNQWHSLQRGGSEQELGRSLERYYELSKPLLCEAPSKYGESLYCNG